MTYAMLKKPLTKKKLYPKVVTMGHRCDICGKQIDWLGPKGFIECCKCKRDLCSKHRVYRHGNKIYCADCCEKQENNEDAI